MSEYILFFFIFSTSLIGMIEVIKTIAEVLFFKKSSRKTLSILPLDQLSEEIEYLIRGALFKTDGQLIVVDMGINESGYSVINKLMEEYARIFVVKQDELCSYLGTAG